MKCGKPVEAEEIEYCRDCSRHALAYTQGRSVWLHTEPASSAIYRLKYHNRRIYAVTFAAEMADRYGSQLRKWEVGEILPIPLHQSKRRRRGFNQAEILARELGKRTGIPLNTCALVRVKKTKPQKRLDDYGRAENLKNAFGVSKEWIPKKNVLLVDDIYTTGNTIHNAAKVLKKAGAENVYFLTISIGQGL